MITDVTGTILVPGNCGRDCLGNGTHLEIVCCCEECDYQLCGLETHHKSLCLVCADQICPMSVYNGENTIEERTI